MDAGVAFHGLEHQLLGEVELVGQSSCNVWQHRGGDVFEEMVMAMNDAFGISCIGVGHGFTFR